MRSYIISSERLGLRKWIESDSRPFIEMNRDKEVMKFFPGLRSEEETLAMIERIKARFEKSGFGLYAVEEKSSRQFIGFTGFSIPVFDSFFTPCIEIGWRLKKEVWGKGYATEAALACLKYGFDQLGFERIASFTSTLNTNSERVMQKIGMVKTGEFDHPDIEISHPLCRHVLYMIEREKEGYQKSAVRIEN